MFRTVYVNTFFALRLLFCDIILSDTENEQNHDCFDYMKDNGFRDFIMSLGVNFVA